MDVMDIMNKFRGTNEDLSKIKSKNYPISYPIPISIDYSFSYHLFLSKTCSFVHHPDCLQTSTFLP